MDLGLQQSGLFFALGLDDPNQLESPEENSFSAHAIARPSANVPQPAFVGIATDLPVGQSSPC